MDEGDRLAANSDLEGALKRYQAAHQIMGVPTTGIEVARTQEKLGHLVEARAVAIEVANSPVAPREPGVFGEARTEAGKLAEQLEARIPSVVVSIGPEGVTTAQAKIEDSRLPQAALGLPIKINPGAHTLEVSATGYLTETLQFTVAEGEQRNLAVTLTPAPNVAAPTQPATTGPVTPTPPPDAPVAEPSHTMTYVAFGVAGASLLVGGGAGVYSLMKTNDAKDKFCNGDICEAGARPLLDDAKTYAWVANIGIGVGVLAAGYGVYTLLFDSDDGNDKPATGARPGPPLSVAVTPRGDGAALIYSGAF